jgi:hypothetical protein
VTVTSCSEFSGATPTCASVQSASRRLMFSNAGTSSTASACDNPLPLSSTFGSSAGSSHRILQSG